MLAAGAVALVMRPRSESAGATGASATDSYAFAPQQYHDGLLILRRWTLGGQGGSVLTETVTASSASGRALSVPFEEAIPTAIASTLKTVEFSPMPSKVVRADPVVLWNLRVPAHGAVVVSYRASVRPSGVSRGRLAAWVKAFEAAEATIHVQAPTTVQIRSLSVRPATLRLSASQSARLKLSGVLRGGKPAPSTVLAGAAWTTGNSSVAIVSPAGQVTALGPGKTYVTGQIGAIHASALVIVGNSSPIPGTHSPAPSPAPSRTRSPSPRPSPSPKPTPTPSPSSPPPPVPVNAYSNYGPANAGHAMCRGNPGNSASMPGGTASQTFTVPSGVASISSALVQIDPDSTVTAHLSVYVNGALAATTASAAAGDTHFSFGPIGVQPGESVMISISFTATYGKIITVYTAGSPGGTFTASNSCPAGAPSMSTSSTGLRAVVSGMS